MERTASETASHAVILLIICGIPCDESVPSFRRIILAGCCKEVKCVGVMMGNYK